MKRFNEGFYTDDFDQEMIDFIVNKLDMKCTGNLVFTPPNLKDRWLIYGEGIECFFTCNEYDDDDHYEYLNKQQFKDKIGMKDMNNNEINFKVGDRVKLINLVTKTGEGTYPEGSSNTVGELGKVIDIGSIGYTLRISVKWDNGFTNSYHEGNLELIETEKKEFTKDDLLIGDVVYLREQYEDVEYWIKYDQDWLVSPKTDSFSLDRFEYNLKHDCRSDCDIMSVYRGGELIWEREELSEKDIKIKELENTLSEIQGNVDKIKQQINELREEK